MTNSYPIKQVNNNAITYTKHGMPSKFAGADGSTTFSIGRKNYINNKNNNNNLEELYKNTKTKSEGKPVYIMSANENIQQKKNLAIGKGSMPDKNSYDLSFKTSTASNYNTIKTATIRCRNSGYVVKSKVN